jgi:hypothetical protein
MLEKTNSMEPASFFNDPTSQTNIEEQHRLCHRILLQDKSICKCDFQTNFSFAELSFHFHEISTEQLAFLMFQHLKPTLKNTIVSAIEFCFRTNHFRSEPLKPVKSKHQDRPFSVR